MASINVNRSVEDPFYRYKMPRILAKVEGKGNGIKTVIVNMSEIARCLSRPPTYPCKYFGCELGAQTQFDPKHDRYIVNGAHDGQKLQELLDGFIRRFVLCPECDNPETNLNVMVKKEKIGQRCIACGYQGTVDTRHKLSTYILRNPPLQDGSTTTTPGKRKGKDKGSDEEKEETQRDGDTFQAPAEVDNDWVNDWGEDTSEEAVKRRQMEELSTAAKSMALNEDLEKTPQERADIFYEAVKKAKTSGIKGQEKNLAAEAERLEIKDKGPLILAEVLFTDKIVEEIKEYRKLFLQFTFQNTKAQKYLLGALEQVIGDKNELMKRVPVILKTFYDTDVIEEEVIIEWGESKASKKYVSKEIAQKIREQAQPFIKWLKEAEEESDEEEEELEVDFSTSGKVGIVDKTPTTNGTAKKPTDGAKATEEEDDFDIDAI